MGCEKGELVGCKEMGGEGLGRSVVYWSAHSNCLKQTGEVRVQINHRINCVCDTNGLLLNT